MPLDRRIVVQLTSAGGRNEYGEYVPGVVTDYGVWAQRSAAGATDEETAEGTRVHAIMTWRVRWFRALSDQPLDRVAVLAEGATWNVESINESDERRRFLDVQAVRRA